MHQTVKDFAKPDEPIGEAVYRFLAEKVLTEENADTGTALLLKLIPIPFWLRWIPLARILDPLFPELLLKLIATVMTKTGLVDERQIHPLNPFK